MKDDVVATVSHELRTPITSIRGFVELLLDATADLTESQMRMLQTIERNAEHLQRVAEDLLADPGAGRGLRVAFTELDLSRLAEDAVHAIQTSATVRGVILTIDPGEEVPIFGDPTRLHQLLGNLLSNAIKFSPRGGRVHVIVDNVDSYARVQVLDEGPGIPEGERDQLFERFYRLASSTEMGVPGTGPGLGHRQDGGRGARGVRRHRRHPGVVDHLPGVSPPRRLGGVGRPDRVTHRGRGLGNRSAGGRPTGPLRRPGTLPTGAPRGARRPRPGPRRAARHACPARPRALGRAPRSGRAGQWWPAGAPPPAQSCPP